MLQVYALSVCLTLLYCAKVAERIVEILQRMEALSS